MVEAYITVIALTHLGVAAILWFFYRRDPSRLSGAFALAWLIQGLRALMLLLSFGVTFPQWAYQLQGVLLLPVTPLLVYSVTEWMSFQVTRRMVAAYLTVSLGFYLLVDYLIAPGLHSAYGHELGDLYRGALVGIIVFVPGGIARFWVSYSFFKLWKNHALPGAFLAAVFSLPYAVGSLTVPLELYLDQPLLKTWSNLSWFLQIFGISIGVIILVMDRQHAALLEALSNVKTLRGLLPICSSCKRVRDDKGYWDEIESYLLDHSDAMFSHAICPSCMAKLYPGFDPDEQPVRSAANVASLRDPQGTAS